MSDNIAIKVENVSKTFRLPHEKNTSVKSTFINFYRRKRTYEKQKVLTDISFEIKKGEFFGVVGRNGSGKSTLLKMLAGIYMPSRGSLNVNGKLTPFIELGVGFSPELTGRENVYLNGALLGFNRKEMNKMYKDIVEFAELERFMDQKLKNYSSGMQVRLAFSIAIRAKSDVLVLDEVLAVGDAAFQKKCLEHFSYLKASKQSVVFVSHDMESIQKYCDRVAWIEQGSLKAIGPPREIIPRYMEIFITNERTAELSKSEDGLPLGISSAVDVDITKAEIKDVWLEGSDKRRIAVVGDSDKNFSVVFQVRARKNIPGAIPGVIISNDVGEFITASNSKWSGSKLLENMKAGKTYEVRFKLPNIYEKGDYKVSVNLVSEEFNTFYAWKNEACRLECAKSHATGGKANPRFEVEVTEL